MFTTILVLIIILLWVMGGIMAWMLGMYEADCLKLKTDNKYVLRIILLSAIWPFTFIFAVGRYLWQAYLD